MLTHRPKPPQAGEHPRLLGYAVGAFGDDRGCGAGRGEHAVQPNQLTAALAAPDRFSMPFSAALVRNVATSAPNVNDTGFATTVASQPKGWR